jgi:hypothetical protein
MERNYKLWEVMAMAEGWDFKIPAPVFNYVPYNKKVTFGKDRVIRYVATGGTLTTEMTGEFVREINPVDFIDAVKAYDKGCTIYCGDARNKIVSKYKPQVINNIKDSFIRDECGETLTPYEILNCKWYIEEEE